MSHRVQEEEQNHHHRYHQSTTMDGDDWHEGDWCCDQVEEDEFADANESEATDKVATKEDQARDKVASAKAKVEATKQKVEAAKAKVASANAQGDDDLAVIFERKILDLLRLLFHLQ